MDAHPGSIPSLEPNGMIHGLPEGHVVGTHPPGAPTAQDGEDSVQNLPVRMDAVSSPRRRPFQQSRGNPLPFGVCKVGRIRCSSVLFAHTI